MFKHLYGLINAVNAWQTEKHFCGQISKISCKEKNNEKDKLCCPNLHLDLQREKLAL